MFKQVKGTIAARIVITAMGLLVAVIAGHRLGTQGLGTIGLITLGITLIRLGTDLLGGGGLVYLVPRVSLGRLLLPCYLWAVVASAAGYGVVHLFHLVPSEYVLDVALLALLQGLLAVHLGVLVGQQRIRANNIVSVVQAVVLIAAFAWYARLPDADAHSFIRACYWSVAVALALGVATMRGQRKPKALEQVQVLRLLFRQGAFVQGANGLQLMNYRLAYWLIEKFRNTSALGIYTVANQLAEGSWLVPKSLALVLYSKISNSGALEEQRTLTLIFLKAALASALAVIVVLLLLPGRVFQWAFGPDVVGITPLVALLAPGILAMAASQAFSHFFSGTARNVHNLVGSGLGLVANLSACLLLIPGHGLHGAAIAASLAYCANAMYQCFAFLRITGSTARDLLPGSADLRAFAKLLSRGGFSSVAPRSDRSGGPSR
jgi:O-antigen/teichoic acid export membrane protein